MKAVGSAVLAGLIAASAANAQAPAAQASSPDRVVEASASYPGLRSGMVLVDRRGAKVGVILETGRTRGHEPAVLVEHNGARFTVRESELKITGQGEEATVLISRARMRQRAIMDGQ